MIIGTVEHILLPGTFELTGRHGSIRHGNDHTLVLVLTKCSVESPLPESSCMKPGDAVCVSIVPFPFRDDHEHMVHERQEV